MMMTMMIMMTTQSGAQCWSEVAMMTMTRRRVIHSECGIALLLMMLMMMMMMTTCQQGRTAVAASESEAAC
jgi:hypothetical protein